MLFRSTIINRALWETPPAPLGDGRGEVPGGDLGGRQTGSSCLSSAGFGAAAPCFVPGLSGGVFSRFLPSFFHSLARAVELQDDGVMHQPVDGRHRRHRILEDLVPLAEHQIRADEQTPPLVALGSQREEHLHLFPALLHVADVVEDEHIVAVELFEFVLQPQVSLGR